ncbi:hypothetical protein IKF94_02565 [Candidatus Saccharibacteria bacterium]|nr:hypothetical protein [Candidatus Saccharibacteria bacterium]
MSRLRKNCTDARFLKVEEKLYKAVGESLRDGNIVKNGASGLASKAKIWGSTFYDHFKNVDDAVTSYAYSRDQGVKDLRDDILCSCPTMEFTFTKVLAFIRKNKYYYKSFIERQNQVPFFSMAKIFRPILARSWSYYGREQLDLCFKMFCGEFFGVIYFWCETEKFDESKIPQHVKLLIRLSQNATRRLS